MSCSREKIFSFLQENWTCTDPDSFQYGRRVCEGVYEFKEFDRNNYVILPNEVSKFLDTQENKTNPEIWVCRIIDLSNYSEDQIKEYIKPYYNSIQQIKDDYEDWQWIIAECIFEQENGLY